jgi:TrmH family RNA methyltransferase
MKMEKSTRMQLKKWESLLLGKNRWRENLFLTEGAKVVDELIKSGWPIECLLVMEERADHWSPLLSRRKRQLPVYSLTAKQWHKLSQDKSPEGIIAIAAVRHQKDLINHLTGYRGHILLLDRINNPNNLGALLRTALWFGFRLVIISKGSVDYTNPKVVRSSMGSLFHLTIFNEMDLDVIMPEIGKRFMIIGSSARQGTHPHPCTRQVAIMLGSETHGLSEKYLGRVDEQWHIPGDGAMESLSLPQAAAIMMYECTKSSQED